LPAANPDSYILVHIYCLGRFGVGEGQPAKAPSRPRNPIKNENEMLDSMISYWKIAIRGPQVSKFSRLRRDIHLYFAEGIPLSTDSIFKQKTRLRCGLRRDFSIGNPY
jgi:hypothetical protein